MITRLFDIDQAVLLAGLLLVASPAVARCDPPTGWFAAGSDPKGYDMFRDVAERHGGTASGSLRATTPQPEKFETMMQMFRADEYRAKRVRLTAWVKVKEVAERAAVWMRVDGAEKTPLAFDNMEKRAPQGTADWKEYDIVLDVPDEASLISFGVSLSEQGQVWVDDLRLEEVGADVPVTDIKRPIQNVKSKLMPEKFRKQPVNLEFEQ